jgi:hypothetical protein
LATRLRWHLEADWRDCTLEDDDLVLRPWGVGNWEEVGPSPRDPGVGRYCGAAPAGSPRPPDPGARTSRSSRAVGWSASSGADRTYARWKSATSSVLTRAAAASPLAVCASRRSGCSHTATGGSTCARTPTISPRRRSHVGRDSSRRETSRSTRHSRTGRHGPRCSA